ncbi:cytochrome P450 704C1 [Elaeis guineensis]|uniref:Cytochrome P450 704C1 n=1 Tax=Elaeis guineensis var. tenera TaxID=51953 RepID=A0A6I9RXH8_ELAGV|nr:cytochrome P450 704C1 [Elaeis guineensis]
MHPTRLPATIQSVLSSLPFRRAMDFSADLVSLSATSALGLLALYCVLRIFHRGGNHKKRYPPVAGTIFHQFLNFRRLHDYHTELSRKYKTFKLLAPFRQQIYTSDPTVVEYILKTNFPNYGKGSFSYQTGQDLFGDGIFVVDGDKWRHQRKLASYEFSTKVLRDSSGAIFKSNAGKLAHIISKSVIANKKLDIQDLFMKSTMDSIFKVGFGMDLDCLQDSYDGSIFTNAFDDSSELIMRRVVNVFWKIMKLLNVGSEAILKERIKVVNDFTYKLIDKRVEQSSNGRNDLVKKEDILSRFLEESKKDPQNMTHQYLRDIVLNFLIAGKDTTAGTLSWFFYMLCKNPSIQEKISQEVKEVTEAKEDATFDDFAKSITDESLNKMHYLHAALSETLRLYPAVPLDNKVCFSDDILPNGFNVRKGDIVFYQPYAMGRMEYLWGKDAECFRPERWLDDNGIFQAESPYKFTAFQAGPRICLGKEFAYRQMKIFAAVLLRFFVFKLSDEKTVANYRTTITLHIDQGLHLHAFLR